MRQLSPNVKITVCSAEQEAGTDAVTGSTLNMSGFTGVMFIAAVGTSAAGNYIKAQQDSDSDMGSAADLEDSKVASGADPTNEVMVLEVHKPQEQYVRAVLARGASTTASPIIAIQYGPACAPRTSGVSGTIVVESHVSPDEGDA